MSILTVYFCGTGSTKFDTHNDAYWNGELISTLASHELGREFAEWAVIDGPGSSNLQADEMFFKSEAYGINGSLFGSGWKENVRHALQLIKGTSSWERLELTEEEYNRLKAAGIPIEDVTSVGSWLWRKYNYGERAFTQQKLQEQIIKMFRKDGVIPTCVNLVGWSRGAISCHMLANMMLNDPELKSVAVNIFAVDPVPGPLNFQPERVTLGANVKDYVGFFARDERSKGFSCVIPLTHSGTKTHIYPMAGRHGTLVGNACVKGTLGPKQLPQPGLIVRHFAERCLTRWGVRLDKMLNLSTSELQNYHHAIEQADAHYVLMRKESYTYFTEQEQGERYVSHGSNGTAFSSVQGPALQPPAGLGASLTFEPSSYRDIR
ncbi:hypothetical protein [Pseudomonas sp. RA_35y_Pfl2_P32]|uniref:hypothetical protein n=1 Tax=Pseudomonas sp. RA_35y_Pfl2_P32 TaxID=3088705 RepID=UPI0030DC6D8D